MIELSAKTQEIILNIFEAEEISVVEKILVEECSNKLPGCKDWDQNSLERVWLSVLKLSGGNLTKFYSAVELAKTDYRDLFMSAGFGRDASAHKKWEI